MNSMQGYLSKEPWARNSGFLDKSLARRTNKEKRFPIASGFQNLAANSQCLKLYVHGCSS